MSPDHLHGILVLCIIALCVVIAIVVFCYVRSISCCLDKVLVCPLALDWMVDTARHHTDCAGQPLAWGPLSSAVAVKAEANIPTLWPQSPAWMEKSSASPVVPFVSRGKIQKSA